jgi:hypothetical protein
MKCSDYDRNEHYQKKNSYYPNHGQIDKIRLKEKTCNNNTQCTWLPSYDFDYLNNNGGTCINKRPISCNHYETKEDCNDESKCNWNSDSRYNGPHGYFGKCEKKSPPKKQPLIKFVPLSEQEGPIYLSDKDGYIFLSDHDHPHKYNYHYPMDHHLSHRTHNKSENTNLYNSPTNKHFNNAYNFNKKKCKHQSKSKNEYQSHVNCMNGHREPPTDINRCKFTNDGYYKKSCDHLNLNKPF